MKALAVNSPHGHRGPIFYIRLWILLFWNTTQRSLEYRFNFFGRAVTEIAWLSSQMVFALALSHGDTRIGSWGPGELFLFFGGVALLDSIFMLLLSENQKEFDSIVRQGTFDFYLLRPISTLFMASLRFPNSVSIINFLFAAGMIAYAIIHLPISLHLIPVLLGLLYFSLGFLLLATFNVFIMGIGFWMTKSNMLSWMFYEFYRLAFRPDDFYFSWLRRVLLSIFPAAFFISIPVKIFLGKSLPFWMWAGPWVLLIIFVPTVLVLWRKGIKNYDGALS